jgi:hypothetical protein
MFNFARKHWSHVLVVLVAVGVLAVPLVFAQWGPPQQQAPEGQLKKWTMKFLAFQNKTSDEIEVHLKYVSKACRDCDFVWFPSPPDKPGDYKFVFKPHEGGTILDENGSPIVVSRIRFFAVSSRGDSWNYTNDDIWVLDPRLGYYEAREIETFTANIE